MEDGWYAHSFSGSEFREEHFSVEKFVNDCRKRVSVEDLRTDLESYFKYLKSAMIELINNDYSDFVTLSSKLVGLERAISKVSLPLQQVNKDVYMMQLAMRSVLLEVSRQLKERKSLQMEKVHLELLVDVIDCVESVEGLMNIDNRNEADTQVPKEISMLRVAVEFNHLQYLVSETQGDDLVQEMLPRIQHITDVLYSSLEQVFCSGLREVDRVRLYNCLHTYSTINQQKIAEDVFRTVFVRPCVEEVISSVQFGEDGVKKMFDRILGFVHSRCAILQGVTEGVVQEDKRLGRVKPLGGYDFLVNSVWPEVVSGLEKRAPVVFAPGNPDTFYKNFTVANTFLEDMEVLCGTEQRVRLFRSHSSYSCFMSKWTLPVYFQIRFQEIAGELEHILTSPLEKCTEGEWELCVFSTAWKGLQTSWKDGVFLPPLVHKFWKLTLQILLRLCLHLRSTLEGKVCACCVCTHVCMCVCIVCACVCILCVHVCVLYVHVCVYCV
jgi:hypothetical protein